MINFLSNHAGTIGWIIVLLVGVHALVAVAQTVWRTVQGRHVFDRELAVLDERLAAARVARRDAQSEAEAWNGYRKFEVAKKVIEGGDICSLYLEPHDRKPLPEYRPGQYLTFRLPVPSEPQPIIRCYSLSDRPSPSAYRVSIKRLKGGGPDQPPGRASNYVHDVVQEGDILDLKAASGHFFLDRADNTPVVLIGGGVGLTPVLSMLNAIAEDATPRETWFFYGVRNRSEHIMRKHLEAMDAAHENIHIHVCHSDPNPDDRAGVDYDHAERVSVELLKRLLPSNNYDYFICGPPGMMAAITSDLDAWGVPKDRIHFEAFGPATVKKTPASVAAETTAEGEVRFSRSGQTIAWDASCDSILELAEKHGIVIDSGCRAGNCGTCLTAIKSGDVTYCTEPGAEPEAGSCLACVCVPKGTVVLDA